jgi:hypothetical protein
MIRMEKSQVDLFKERQKRIEDTVQMKIADRVPTIMDFGILTAKYGGIPLQEIYYDQDKWAGALKRVVLDFQPDMFHCTVPVSGDAWEAIDTKLYKWPGHGGPSDHIHQFVEGEYMKADEYDAFLQDRADFVIRTYLPRVCGAAAPFAQFPYLGDFMGIGAAGGAITAFARPEVVTSCLKIHEAAVEIQKRVDSTMAFVKEMNGLGYPSMYNRAAAQAPFDYFADNLRGMRGAMLDMYRQPDKLLEAMAKVQPVIIKRAVSAMEKSKQSGNAMLFIGPHKGAEGFMSVKQFGKFYWPGMKAVILALIEAGITPYMFWEGDYTTSRLEFLAELPKGKVINRFDRGDIFKAKEVIGDRQCIAGGVLPALLQTGSVQDVKDHCKKLIDVVGKNGGFIMSTSCAMDEAKPENVKAMIDFTREYGVYR